MTKETFTRCAAYEFIICEHCVGKARKLECDLAEGHESAWHDDPGGDATTGGHVMIRWRRGD